MNITDKIEETINNLSFSARKPSIVILGRKEYDDLFYEQYGTVRYEEKMQTTTISVAGVEAILDKNSQSRFQFFYSNEN